MTSIVNVKASGTRSSGASEADNWDDGNCYPSCNASSAVWVDDTIVTLDNTAPILETAAISDADFASCTDFTMNSRSGAKATLAINHATTPLFNASPAATTAIEINDIILTRAVTMTSGATLGLMYFYGTVLVTLDFNRCEIGGFDINAWDPASKYGIAFSSASTVARTTTFTDCLFRDMNHTAAGHSSIIRCGGTNQTFNFVRTGWRDCALLANEDTVVGFGLYAENNATVNITDGYATNMTYGAGDTAIMCRPFYYSGVATPTINIDGFDFAGMIVGTAAATVEGNGWGFHIKHPHSVKNVSSSYCVFHNTTGFDGGQLYIDAATAVQSERTTGLTIHGCQSRSGCALFVSNGGTGVYENIIAYDCDTDAGVIYSGGSGDFELNGALVYDCRSSAGNDGMIYARNNTETRNKVAKISNCTVVDCTTGGDCAGIAIENATSGYTMTATINNCISRNSGSTYDIMEDAGSTVTTNNCNVLGTTSVTTDNDLTTTDPALDSDYKVTTVALLTGGLKHWTGSPPVGVGGEPFPSWDISVGAHQSTAVASHPTQL